MTVRRFVEEVIYVYDCGRVAAGNARLAAGHALLQHRYLLHAAPDGSSREMIASLTEVGDAG